MSTFIEVLNKKYFDSQLSPTTVSLLAKLPLHNLELQKLLERLCKLMKNSNFLGKDFSHGLAWEISTALPKIIVGTWGGNVPSITFAGRHRKIDEYIQLKLHDQLTTQKTLIDLGCGFPPLTTLETAKCFQNWQIFGVDPLFPEYIVYDTNGDYAFFNQDKAIQYFQSGEVVQDRWEKMWENLAETRSYFSGLLEELIRELPVNDILAATTVTKNNTKLIKNPIKSYATQQLSFLCEAVGKGDLDIPKADVIRCFNVLLYFDRAFRNRILKWAADNLKADGIFICGSNALGNLSKYTIYIKEGENLVEKEFAFSIDNLRPLMMITWLTLHDDDYETCFVVDAIKVIRANDEFCQDFDLALDTIQAELGVCPRGEDGCLGGVDPGMFPVIQEKSLEIENRLVQAGYVDKAISVLQEAGYHGSRNLIGHIAITPKNPEIIRSKE